VPHWRALVLALISGCSLQPRYDRARRARRGTYPSARRTNRAGRHHAPGGRQSAGATSCAMRACSGSWRSRSANNRDLRVAVLNVEQVRAHTGFTRGALPRLGDSPTRPEPVHRPESSSSGTAARPRLRGRRPSVVGDRFLWPGEEHSATPRCSSTSPRHTHGRLRRSCSYRRSPINTSRCSHSTRQMQGRSRPR